MSYIIKSTNPFVSIKLTETGRQQLALGQLNFASWAIGDSELNYNREAIVDANPTDVRLSGSSKVLRPFDEQPNLKYFITPLNASTPFQTMNPADINVIKAVVNNEATTRGFFTASGGSYTTITGTASGSTYTVMSFTINTSNFSGGTILVAPASGFTTGNLVLAKLGNSSFGSVTPNENTNALANLWFQITSANGYTMVVDRNLPNLSNYTGISEVIIYQSGEVYNTIGTGNTTAYWDTGTLAFDSASNVTCSNVPVWNMNNVWCENLAGITGLTTTKLYADYTRFGSYRFLGQKNPYLEYLCSTTGQSSTFNCNGPGLSYPDGVSKSISIIHYTNNTISSLYGEFLYIDTTNNKKLVLTIPDLMYHNIGYATGSGTSMGMSFVSSGSPQYIGTSNIEYVPLIENPAVIPSGATPQVVGKVFQQLKIVVIDNDEIVAALSYKSNRNWTLPPLAGNLVSPSLPSTGLLLPNQTIYLTYSLENNGTTGLTTSLPCQSYTQLTNNTSTPQDIAFRMNSTGLLPYMRKVEKAGYDGRGFYANQFRLLYQIVQDATIRPDPGAWSAVNFTTTAITTTTGATIDPTLLENQNPLVTGFNLTSVNNTGATIFDITQSLNMATVASPTSLQFGDERFFYGNLDTYIGATIFKTIFDIRVNSGQFNATTNPTRSTDPSTNPPNIKISEVGIYDSLNNLVCIGKLSTPVALQAGNTIMLELSMDF